MCIRICHFILIPDKVYDSELTAILGMVRTDIKQQAPIAVSGSLGEVTGVIALEGRRVKGYVV